MCLHSPIRRRVPDKRWCIGFTSIAQSMMMYFGLMIDDQMDEMTRLTCWMRVGLSISWGQLVPSVFDPCRGLRLCLNGVCC